MKKMDICIPHFIKSGVGNQKINSDYHSILDPRPLPSLTLCNFIVQPIDPQVGN